MKLINNILLIGCTALLCSCNLGSEKYQEAMNLSGQNRAELERVINYYDSIGDVDKLRAAFFLIENMVGKKSVYPENISVYNELLHCLRNKGDSVGWDPRRSVVAREIDSMLRLYSTAASKSNDLERIDAEVLRNNVEYAFAVWNNAPWKEQYTFEDFCEYVLPYKVGCERPENWRKAVLDKNLLQPNLPKIDKSQFDVAVELINSTGLYYNVGMTGFPYPMTFSDIDLVQKGACGQMASLALFYFRANGIPSAIDMIPAWANRSSSHIWNAIILPNGKSRSISYRPDGTNDLAYKISKIYRRTYVTQPSVKTAESEVLPQLFQDNDLVDVTRQYDMPLSDVKIALTVDVPSENVYLATFDNSSWVPVARAPKRGVKVKFTNMGRGVLPRDCDNLTQFINQGNGIVYLPVYSLEQGVVGAGNPFILDTLGEIRELVPSVRSEKVRLTRKYPKDPKFEMAENAMIRGRFEAANKRDFSDAQVLCEISYPPRDGLGSVAPNHKPKCRYVRYVPAEGVNDGCYSEFVFYDMSNNPISGKALSGGKAFDGDILTYAEKLTSYEYDFGTPLAVSRIDYGALSDDNGISVGDEYELFYWDGKWLSLGRQVAEQPYLDYDVPNNALFWLRNLTKGVEERIFTVHNNTQIWW